MQTATVRIIFLLQYSIAYNMVRHYMVQLFYNIYIELFCEKISLKNIARDIFFLIAFNTLKCFKNIKI